MSNKGIIRNIEADTAVVEIIHPNISKFSVSDWLNVEATQERIDFKTNRESHFEILRDLVVSVFSNLSETPVKAFGINHLCHFTMKDKKDYENFGYWLSPVKIFNDLLKKPRLQTIQFRDIEPDKEGEGNITITISPSDLILDGKSVVFNINNHFKETQGDATLMIKMLVKSWENSFSKVKKDKQFDMAESRTLESESKGNWIKENVLTKSNYNEDQLKIYQSVIQKYSNDISNYKEATKVMDAKDNSPKLKLEFPRLHSSYDLLNSKKYYTRIQNWQGMITEIKDESFKAKLSDLSSGGTDEIAEFDIKEISPSDEHLLEIGSLFYWSLGSYMENGQMVNRSEIRFQRLINLDVNDIENTKRNIEKKYSNLKERKLDHPITP
ncbi:hypothetical protein [Maribacter aestuarii]|uniref:hypothetical protein n=1 Tax=Maribacter aestuarii TaxID=1130723 RepID=UPI0025A53D50|nr:hypothetical protein [Maribacter aestuarii]